MFNGNEFMLYRSAFLKTLRVPMVVLFGLLLSACGGGGGGGNDVAAPASAPTLSLTTDIKTLDFGWTAVSGATFYRLAENSDGASGFTPIGGDLANTSYRHDIAVHRHNWSQARYVVEACNSAGCGPASNAVDTIGAMLSAIGYFKASNTGENDVFGFSVALSADGNTLAVGAGGEASNATGINNDQTNDLAAESGAVYLY